MTEQVETTVIELSIEDLEQVQGGLICRKAGKEQQEYLTAGGDQGIIAI
jgi:bacteriocin-like protein